MNRKLLGGLSNITLLIGILLAYGLGNIRGYISKSLGDY